MTMARPRSAFTAASSGDSFTDTASADGYKSDQLPQETRRFLLLPLPQLQHPSASPRPQVPPPSYLALMNTGRHQFSYSLKQLSIPHNLTLLTQTPSFWQQFDLVDHSFLPPDQQPPAFGYNAYNYLHDPFTMSQDFVPVFIGSNTANGKILKSDESGKRRKYRGNDLFKPYGYIVLAIEGEAVDEIRLQDLIRFSKAVGALFAENKEERAESEAKLGFTVNMVRSQPGKPRTVNLVNSHTQIWTTVTAWAFAEVLSWMQTVRSLPRSADLPQLLPVGMEDYALHDLVAIYAATVTLDIRPRGVTSSLRARIIRTLAYRPSTAADWQFMHERLPVGDVVLRKLVETFFVHGERGHYGSKAMLRGEVERIQGYVNGCGHEEFREMVVGIMEKRNAPRRAAEGLNGVKGKGKGKGKGKEKVGDGNADKAEDVEMDVGGETVSATPQDSVVGSPAGKAAKA